MFCQRKRGSQTRCFAGVLIPPLPEDLATWNEWPRSLKFRGGNGGTGGIDYAVLRLCGVRWRDLVGVSLRAKMAVKPGASQGFSSLPCLKIWRRGMSGRAR